MNRSPLNHSLHSIETYSLSDLPALKQMLEREREICAELNATVYANNDWGGAPDAKIGRLCLAIECLQAGAKSVQPFLHHGIGVNGVITVSPNKQKFYSQRHKKWLWYDTISELMDKLKPSTSMTIADIRKMMAKKQEAAPSNDFWKDEARVKKWLQDKDVTVED